MARPTKYSQSICNEICEQIATSSVGLRRLVKSNPKLPAVSTIMKWLFTDKNKEFIEHYARAREAQAEIIADEIIEIADDATNDFMTITKGDLTYEAENKEVTNRSRLRIQARQFIASKLAPKKFGDKLDLTASIDARVSPLSKPSQFLVSERTTPVGSHIEMPEVKPKPE